MHFSSTSIFIISTIIVTYGNVKKYAGEKFFLVIYMSVSFIFVCKWKIGEMVKHVSQSELLLEGRTLFLHIATYNKRASVVFISRVISIHPNSGAKLRSHLNEFAFSLSILRKQYAHTCTVVHDGIVNRKRLYSAVTTYKP